MRRAYKAVQHSIVFSALRGRRCCLQCGPRLRSRPTTILLQSGFEWRSLKTALHKAQAIRDIKRLQYSYAHYAESGLWLDLGDLFATNGVAHYAQGDFRGPESLRKFYLQELGRGQLGLAEGRIYPHIMIQPVVTVAEDGKTARGRWHVIAMLGSYGASASWAGVVYENRYVFEDGVWKISELSYNSQYSGRYSPPGLSLSKWDLPYHFTAAIRRRLLCRTPICPPRPTARPVPRTSRDCNNDGSSSLAARNNSGTKQTY